jgi:hypothetical protein
MPDNCSCRTQNFKEGDVWIRLRSHITALGKITDLSACRHIRSPPVKGNFCVDGRNALKPTNMPHQVCQQHQQNGPKLLISWLCVRERKLFSHSFKPHNSAKPNSLQVLWVKTLTQRLLTDTCEEYSTEICGLLGYYAALCGNCLPMFRDNVSFPSSRVKSLNGKESL